MKFNSFLLFLLLPICLCASDWTLEVRGAYFQPSSKQFRKVYSSCLIDYQVETSKRVHPLFEVWAGINWMNKKGNLRDDYSMFKQKNRIYILPLTLGFKFTYPLTNYLDIYTGAGACYSFLHIKHRWEDFSRDSSYSSYFSSLKKHISKHGVGVVAKVGLRWTIGPTTFIDLFADYFVQQFHFSRKHDFNGNHVWKHLNCDGLKLGAGFGVYF
ncbi:hypothetical protein [Candidatus Protochlamydia amoebophila]|uniref:Outer membrane protein beta-barrel domain-containing protein n=1 Tax=Protochlamydia amoebophila (strain UWE25) TaxID=264201 RepID=A0A2P9HAC4_PARUW|nr:hypothetical protein [Candidatus Protochlamydia amoebophila]SPJ31956.1 unnamed protein product [Candidatus Protochlamydia amoebophila UWE25]